jgi:hypothetical protein
MKRLSSALAGLCAAFSVIALFAAVLATPRTAYAAAPACEDTCEVGTIDYRNEDGKTCPCENVSGKCRKISTAPNVSCKGCTPDVLFDINGNPQTCTVTCSTVRSGPP